MIRFKIRDNFYKVVDGYTINESSREVKFSNLKIDFTDKTIADLPLKYQECQLVEGEFRTIPASDGITVEGTNFYLTDVDLTKKHEFREFDGNISQSGTPTPSNPLPVNTVTGSQEITVCKKNLMPNDLENPTVSGLTITIGEDNSILLNGTNTANVDLHISENVYLPAGTYTTSIHKEGTVNNSCYLVVIDMDGTEISGASLNMRNADTKTFTLSEGKYVYFRLYSSTNRTFTNFKIYPMIEKGSTASDYEKYNGNNYEITLSENLFDGNLEQGSFNSTTGATTSATTRVRSTNFINVTNDSYTFSTDNNSTFDIVVYIYDTSGTYIRDESTISWTALPYTKTFAGNRKIKFGIRYKNNATITPSNVSGVEVYNKTPIELCKIGDAQDRIYKENGTWYLEKKIGKVVFDGTESGWWWNSGNNRAQSPLTNAKSTTTVYSNFFIGGSGYNDRTVNSAYIYDNNYIWFYLDSSEINSLSAFKTWLGTHNTLVYYVLNTPTIEEITDTNLISQLNAAELLEGVNNIVVSSGGLAAIINVHYNYNDEYEINRVDNIIYTGYINNFILPNMKNKKEYRELEIDLLSPLSIATLRTVDAIGTYNLQPLVKELIQPLIDDGFTLKEFNIGNNQITVNYLMETVESALNKLSNKFSFWWHIDINKNIYINSISYLMSLKPKLIYNDDNKINGLIDIIPSIDATDYCNTIDFVNVRVYSDSFYNRRYIYNEEKQTYELKKEYYNPIIDKDFIRNGDEIEFAHPVVVNKKIKHTAGGYLTHVQDQFLSFSKINSDRTYSNLFTLDLDNNGEMVLPANVSIEDSYTDTNTFVLVKDPFFSNLIVGMKYNGNDDIEVGIFLSSTALVWSKIRILDEVEINKNKNVISQTGIVEKQIDMSEQWKTYDELIDIANSYVNINTSKADTVKLNLDEDISLMIGDTIKIEKDAFLVNDTYIITDKDISHSNNYTQWKYTLKNTNILENYVDLFRAGEKEEEENRNYELMTASYIEEGIKERYEVS